MDKQILENEFNEKMSSIQKEIYGLLTDRGSQYKDILIKGAFLSYNQNWYPLKILFFPRTKNSEQYESKIMNYGDLLLVDTIVDINTLKNCVG